MGSRDTSVFGKSYGTHDFDAGHDPKCTALIITQGLAAYARYWLLIECMGRSAHGYIDLGAVGQRAVLESELWFAQTPGETLDGFLEALAGIGLISAEALERGHVVSEPFLRRQDWLETKAAVGRRGGKESARTRAEAGA